MWDDWAAARPASSDTDHDHVPVTTPLLNIPVSDLVYWMGKFVLETRKTDGQEYLPKTLYLVCCFKRYYEANGVHTVIRMTLGLEAFDTQIITVPFSICV